MRALPAVLALVLLVVLAPAAEAAGFGLGPTVFRDYEVGGVNSAPEPTIGIPWNTDSLFFHAGSTTIKGVFAADDNVTWSDVTPPYQVPTNLDPMLVADEDTGRILAGGLHGPCSVMMYSDDDGATWLPTGNMCSGAQFDHQSIGIGPKPMVGNPQNLPQLQNAYYCGQLGQIGCSVSFDGGVTWTAPTPSTGACGGFHGHWRISRVTGAAFLPVGDCGNQRGLLAVTAISSVTGFQFEPRLVAGSHPWIAGFDPSIGISRDNGWVYYGDADHKGAFMALSKNEGNTWEQLPGADGTLTTWVDVGAFHDPPIVAATFADVQAGDDDRAAFTFMGIEWHPDIDLDYVQSDMIFSCADRQDELVWHYYAAFTYDAGQNWTVTRVSADPVQVGGVYDSLGGHTGGCRNLLDFNDMDIDSKGRAHIGYADGCIGECAEVPSVESQGARSQAPRVLRQVAGNGLFAAFDVEAPGTPPVVVDPTPTGPTEQPTESVPGFGVLGLLACLAVLLARRR